MGDVFKVAAFAVTAAMAALTVKEVSHGNGYLVGLAACALLGIWTIKTAAAPVVSFAKELRDVTGLNGQLVSPLMKTLGIALVSELAASLCRDAGESSLAKGAELSGALLALYAALPLMTALLDMVEELM